MSAAITDDSYNQQVTSIFDFLKSASPQQLAQVAQSVQQNPQSPEATALAMANNYQQQMRSGQAQAPQQTVYQKQIQQLLQSAQPQQQDPMQGGVAAAGNSQYSLQDAAAQDPMRNAGIGAAPENAPPPPGAATGGLVALAHGGSVRGFSGMYGSYADLQDEDVTSHPSMWSEYSPRKAHPSMGRSIDIALEKPDVRDERYPITSMLDTMAEEQPEAETYGTMGQQARASGLKASNAIASILGLPPSAQYKLPDVGFSQMSPSVWRAEGTPLVSDDEISASQESTPSFQNAPPAQQTLPENTRSVSPAGTQPRTPDQRPRSMATPQNSDRIASPTTSTNLPKQETKKPELTAEQQISELEKLLNVDTPMAMELKGQMEKRHAESKRDNTMMALAQGIGSMMAAQTPHVGQALGAGILAGAGAYQSGEDRLDKQQAAIDALQLRPELMQQANRQTAFTAMMDQEKAKIAALAKFREDRAKFGEQVALKNMEGSQQESLKRMDIGADKAKLMMQARQSRELEILKNELQQHGVKPEQASSAYMKAYQTLVENGQDPTDPATAQMAAEQARGSFHINTSAPTALPTPVAQPAGGGMFYTPPR